MNREKILSVLDNYLTGMVSLDDAMNDTIKIPLYMSQRYSYHNSFEDIRSTAFLGFIQAFKRRRAFESAEMFLHYIMKTIKFSIISFLNRDTLIPVPASTRLLNQIERPSFQSFNDDQGIDFVDPKDHLSAVMVSDTSNYLDPRTRQILELRLENYTYDEIAQRMGLTKQRISQIFREIREIINNATHKDR
jgi:RNA polymerase sigma factor (sigma-70 family)